MARHLHFIYMFTFTAKINQITQSKVASQLQYNGDLWLDGGRNTCRGLLWLSFRA